MIRRNDLPNLLKKVLLNLGGRADMMSIFKEFYRLYGNQLSPDEELFYTWNYDIRWAATRLRKRDEMEPARKKENTHGDNIAPKGIWALKGY